jgi:L-histidine N-alpha-methyltransferase
VEVLRRADRRAELAEDARCGLGQVHKSLPPKYLYDSVGSRLFEEICRTEEYYQPRAEQSLLEATASRLLERARPRELVELGSGDATKTRILLDAAGRKLRYVPFDVCEDALVRSGARLLDEYPWLFVHAYCGDYERDLRYLAPGERRLYLFLGSTIGNLEEHEAARLLVALRTSAGPDDLFLFGLDTVKDKRVLDAAYNDARGVTAAFNKNVLEVLNRELGATFEPESFRHVAFFDEAEARVEMHLEAVCGMSIEVAALGESYRFEQGERIRTEISRKFSVESARRMLFAGGLELIEWHTTRGREFALALARPRPPKVAL